MSDGDSLLRVIREQPGEDTPRLAYADEIEYRQPERAEFIRVQVELERPCPACRGAGEYDADHRPGKMRCRGCFGAKTRRGWQGQRDGEWKELAARERELWGYLPARDGIMKAFQKELPAGWAVLLGGQDTGGGLTHDYPWAFVTRGFVGAVTLSAAAFLGGPCPGCIEPGELDDGDPRCRLCHGTGRTPGLAASLFAAHPIEQVTLSDRNPAGDEDDRVYDGNGWWWYRRNPRFATRLDHHLEQELFDLLEGGEVSAHGGPDRSRHYRTELEARAAFSLAACAYGRAEAAGLTRPAVAAG